MFKKLYDLLESDCHNLNVTLFRLRVEGADDVDQEFNFDQAVTAEVRRQQDLREKIISKQESLDELEDELPLLQLQTKATKHSTPTVPGNGFREMIYKAGQLRDEITELVCSRLF